MSIHQGGLWPQRDEILFVAGIFKQTPKQTYDKYNEELRTSLKLSNYVDRETSMQLLKQEIVTRIKSSFSV